MIPKTIQDMISDIFKNYSRLQAEKLSRIVFCDANMFSLASSRCSVSQGAAQKHARKHARKYAALFLFFRALFSALCPD